MKKAKFSGFFIRIVIPAMLTISLFVIAFFEVIIPEFEDNLMNRKRDLIRELTNIAWHNVNTFYLKSKDSLLSETEAKNKAIESLNQLRYGDEDKDYFWVIDSIPRMIMHPYRQDLIATNLSDYTDKEGKLLFVESVNMVKDNGEGYVDYVWQWKDDSSRIVPKVSFVKEFEPWGWIIGTGIYIEDVHEEIGQIESRIVNVSIVVFIIVTVLLLIILLQSHSIEKQRASSESELQKSRERYKKLVESVGEGTMMILKGEFIYANTSMLEMLGYTQNEFQGLYLYDLFLHEEIEEEGGMKYFRGLKDNPEGTTRFEANLKKRNGDFLTVELTTRAIEIAGDKGYTMIARDISSDMELQYSRQRFKNLTDSLNVGVFRLKLKEDIAFLEANKAFLFVLGYEKLEDLNKKGLDYLFFNRNEWDQLYKLLLREDQLRDYVIGVQRYNGEHIQVSLSCRMEKDDSGDALFCDGILEDISEQARHEQERENLISELQASLMFLHQPVKNIASKVVYTGMHTPIYKVAKLIMKSDTDSVLVKTQEEDVIGIIDNKAISERIVGERLSLETPVFEIMSSPVHTVRSDALLFEAALEMQNKACNVLAIKGNTNDIVGLVTTDSILQVHKYSTGVIIQQIEAAESIDEIRSIRLKIPKLIRAYISSGANASNVTRIISAIADSIAERVIELVVNEIGKPPVQFAFMVMGSEGREEQTLKTDQDNAIVYEDVEVSMQTETEEYFHLLAEKVNKSLDTIGYALCKGGIMASNPEWCKPLSVWKDYFHSWSKSGDGKDLMDVNIFFDFRFVYGEGGLVDELKTYVIGELKKSDVFYYHMAESVLAFKPPLNIFGNIVLDANESGTTFDIKKVLMAISGFARLYSLKNSIQETNTLRRIHKLFDKGILQGSVYQEMIDAYDYLMLIRFKNQVAQMEEGNSPDNLIPLSGLSHIEQTLIKNILTQISGFLSKLSVDFKSVL